MWEFFGPAHFIVWEMKIEIACLLVTKIALFPRANSFTVMEIGVQLAHKRELLRKFNSNSEIRICFVNAPRHLPELTWTLSFVWSIIITSLTFSKLHAFNVLTLRHSHDENIMLSEVTLSIKFVVVEKSQFPWKNKLVHFLERISSKMNSLRRSARLCAVFNGTNVPVRQVSSTIKKILDDFEAKKSTYEVVAPIWRKDSTNESFILYCLLFQNKQKPNSILSRNIRFIECVALKTWAGWCIQVHWQPCPKRRWNTWGILKLNWISWSISITKR